MTLPPPLNTSYVEFHEEPFHHGSTKVLITLGQGLGAQKMHYEIPHHQILASYTPPHVMMKKHFEKISDKVAQAVYDELVYQYGNYHEKAEKAGMTSPIWADVKKSDEKFESFKFTMNDTTALLNELKAYQAKLGGPYSAGGYFAAKNDAVNWAIDDDLAHGIVSSLAKAIPGFREMKQSCPMLGTPHCTRPTEKYLLYSTIIHLNDHHKWSREEIADWLETLDHDLTMHAPGEEVKTP